MLTQSACFDSQLRDESATFPCPLILISRTCTRAFLFKLVVSFTNGNFFRFFFWQDEGIEKTRVILTRRLLTAPAIEHRRDLINPHVKDVFISGIWRWYLRKTTWCWFFSNRTLRLIHNHPPYYPIKTNFFFFFLLPLIRRFQSHFVVLVMVSMASRLLSIFYYYSTDYQSLGY